jgi:hypothetical protein
MLRRIFLHLLKRFSKTENERLAILREMWPMVLREYNEQTYPGNVYNFQIEFILSNDYIKMLSMSGDEKTLDAIKQNIADGTVSGINFLKSENPKITGDQVRDVLIKYKGI